METLAQRLLKPVSQRACSKLICFGQPTLWLRATRGRGWLRDTFDPCQVMSCKVSDPHAVSRGGVQADRGGFGVGRHYRGGPAPQLTYPLGPLDSSSSQHRRTPELVLQKGHASFRITSIDKLLGHVSLLQGGRAHQLMQQAHVPGQLIWTLLGDRDTSNPKPEPQTRT